MGWTTMYVGWTNESNKALMTKEIERSGQIKVQKASVVNGVYYGALQMVNDPTHVWAMVCLMRRSERFGEFSYKDIDETCGPVESKCPACILKLLTPTDSDWANEWRARCWDYAKGNSKTIRQQLNALPIGEVIKANGKILLIKHKPAYRKKRPFFMCLDKFAYVPIKDIQTFEVIERPAL